MKVNSLMSSGTGTSSQSDIGIINVIDSIPALVAYIDCNMILQYCNQPFRTWFAINGEASGKSFPVVAGKDLFDQLQRHLGKVLIGDRAHFEVSVQSTKGLEWLDATLSPDFDDRRRVKGFIFHGSDITEKARTERNLKDYFENASIGLHWVDANGVITWANPAELKMLGYSSEEYVGHHISEFHADKGVIEDILCRLSAGQTLRNQHADLLCKDGSVRHVAINSSVLWEEEKFVHTRCFTVDITQQSVAAKALQESEEKFRMMATLVPLILWTTDSNGECNFLNGKWEVVTGKSIVEGLGRQWLNFIHPEDRENISRSWEKSFSMRKTFEAKFRFLNSNGAYDVTYANSTPRRSEAGQFMGYVGIFQDISSEEKVKSSLEKMVIHRTEDLRKRNEELKIAEEKLVEKNLELEKINKQLSSFAHIASHDLQEPVRKIQTFANRIVEVEGDKLSSKGLEYVHRIAASSDRMRNLIKSLLTWSQSIESEENYEIVDLNLIIDEVISELEIKIAEKTASIENLGLPKLQAVKFRIHQLFLNLLSNALKFSKPNVTPHVIIKSEITVGHQTNLGMLLHGQHYHHISVSDNGIGFDDKFSDKIFEKFQRLHAHTSYEGTGIGLAICKEIVDKHKGAIVASGREEMGATFHIYLPTISEILSTA